MKRGLLYVVFGEQYDKLAAHAIAHSRQFTDLPICVLTNIKDRCEKWDEVNGVQFYHFPFPQKDNRLVKTRMIAFTPFDETLYLDCDSVIQSPGIEQAFDMLDGHDMVLNLYTDWEVGDKVLRLYRKAMRLSETTLPLRLYNGAFICFRSNEAVSDFFIKWANYWVLTGKGREMPALACAVKNSGIKVNVLPRDYFEPSARNERCVVQHNYNSCEGKHFHQEFGLPLIREYKPFDGGAQSDWNWVDFDGDQ